MSALSAGLRESVSSCVTLLIGLFFFISIPSQIADFGGEGVDARTMPYLIAAGIIAFSFVSIVMTIKKHAVDASAKDAEAKQKTHFGAVFAAFLAITLWIILLPYLGYNLTTILLITTMMLIIGNATWWQIVILSLALSFPVNYLLAIVLKVYLPSGSLFN